FISVIQFINADYKNKSELFQIKIFNRSLLRNKPLVIGAAGGRLLPGEGPREDPAGRGKGRKAKTATSCRNACSTNILWAGGLSPAGGSAPPGTEIRNRHII